MIMSDDLPLCDIKLSAWPRRQGISPESSSFGSCVKATFSLFTPLSVCVRYADFKGGSALFFSMLLTGSRQNMYPQVENHHVTRSAQG